MTRGPPARTGADVFSPSKRSEVMRAVRSRDTGAELALRRALFARGLRYRLHRKDLPGSPDIVFPSARLAVFVHGCFWHGHDCPRGARAPKSNAEYWSAKIARTRIRDARNAAALMAAGWRVLVVWECDLARPDALDRVRAGLDAGDDPTTVAAGDSDARGPKPC